MGKKKYIIIEESGVIALSNRISEIMDEGDYIPFGSLVVTNSGKGIQPPSFCQAMILKEKE